MVRKPRRRIFGDHNEEDPMAGSANLVDAMLVLAVGFLVFVVLSWNMQSVMFSDMTPQEKKDTMEAISSAVEVNQGNELNNTPQTSNGSGNGYAEVGTVYKDPKTGKLILIEG
jgi:hypothetical protein